MGTAVAKRTATAVKLKPIADVVRQIKTHIYDANNAEGRCVKHRLQAGQLLLQLRERIESGEAGNGITGGSGASSTSSGAARTARLY